MNWFRKWSFDDQIPMDDVYKRLIDLEQKYEGLLHDVVRLEEENIETSNSLYELMNSIEAIDRRIDILFDEFNK